MKTIDLFAGVGGIRLGFEKAFGDELDTIFVSEWDEKAQKTYKANFPSKTEFAGDITKVNEADIPSFDICLSSPPCQAFSTAGKREGFNDNYKGICRGTLFFDVARICDYHKPKVIFCENVKGLVIHDKKRTFQIIKNTFEEIGYKVFYKILNSKDFGVPQRRERVYLVCFRNDIAPETFTFPSGIKSKICLRDILEEDIPLHHFMSQRYLNSLRERERRHKEKGNGFSYQPISLDSISNTIASSSGSHEMNLIIDDRKEIDFSQCKKIVNTEYIRRMTPREWARLQGYDDTFIFPNCDTTTYKQLGNSVTVPVIQAIATEIKKVLKKQE